jgi:hypothetical protein
MGSTVNGLPWPEPTAPVRDGAAAIRALAEALENRGGGRDVQAGQTIVTTNQFGQFRITPARTIASQFPSVMFSDGSASTSDYALFGAEYLGTNAQIGGFARYISNLGVWAANISIRVNWLVVQ